MLFTMLATVLVFCYIHRYKSCVFVKNPYLRTLFNIAGRSETNQSRKHFSEKTDVYITNLTFCKFIHRPCVDVSLTFGIFPLDDSNFSEKVFGTD